MIWWLEVRRVLLGSTNASYTIASVVAGDAGSYDVVVSGVCGAPATSGGASLTVNQNVLVVGSPASLTNCPGTSATFSVNASGTGLSYQWRKGGAAILGATNASYTIASVVAGDAGSYDVVVSGVCGAPATPGGASLTGKQNVLVGGGPAPVANCPGPSAHLRVKGRRPGLSYQ